MKNNEFESMVEQKVLPPLTRNIGILEKVFGQSSIILYNKDKERAKNTLKYVYGYSDVDKIFQSELDEEQVKSILDILFRVPQLNPQGLEDKEKSMFNIFS